MAGSMKSVTETGIELSNEERNLLSVAYKVRRWQQALDAWKSRKENHLRQNFKWRKNIFFVIQEGSCMIHVRDKYTDNRRGLRLFILDWKLKFLKIHKINLMTLRMLSEPEEVPGE